MERDKIYIEQIKEFCRKIISFSVDISYEKFVEDEQLHLSIVKLIENIGEASKRLSNEARLEYKLVDWKKAMAMRDKLVHDYMEKEYGKL